MMDIKREIVRLMLDGKEWSEHESLRVSSRRLLSITSDLGGRFVVVIEVVPDVFQAAAEQHRAEERKVATRRERARRRAEKNTHHLTMLEGRDGVLLAPAETEFSQRWPEKVKEVADALAAEMLRRQLPGRVVVDKRTVLVITEHDLWGSYAVTVDESISVEDLRPDISNASVAWTRKGIRRSEVAVAALFGHIRRSCSAHGRREWDRWHAGKQEAPPG